jgi:peptidoglycan-N-acetylglucosamine deacetylase
VFGGTKALYSSDWAQADQQHKCARSNGLKSTVKRMVLSAFHAVDHVPEKGGVLFTFDDGPDPEVTPRVLKLLAKYDVKAIFFVVGSRIPRAPEMLKQIVAAGHWIGNHTFSHPLDHIPRLSEYSRDVRACQMAIEQTAGIQPSWFRPPLGAITAASLLSPWMAGLHSMLWSIDVGDWQLRSDDDAVAAGERLASRVGPGDVVLLHDDNRHVVTLLETALPRIADRFQLNAALAELEGVAN